MIYFWTRRQIFFEIYISGQLLVDTLQILLVLNLRSIIFQCSFIFSVMLSYVCVPVSNKTSINSISSTSINYYYIKKINRLYLFLWKIVYVLHDLALIRQLYRQNESSLQIINAIGSFALNKWSICFATKFINSSSSAKLKRLLFFRSSIILIII